MLERWVADFIFLSAVGTGLCKNLVGEWPLEIHTAEQPPQSMVQDEHWLERPRPGRGALKQLDSFPARVLAATHVSAGASKRRRKFPKRCHSYLMLQQPDHPLTIPGIAQPRLEEKTGLEHQPTPEEHGATQGR